MRVAGIIAEYNPLHNGHVYHLQQTRQSAACDYIMVVMSGDYVQRGEPAITDKFVRAQWALEAGADLVLELPVACAIASAERFAAGGVRVLAGTGVLDALCFGSETPDIHGLEQAAMALAQEPPAFRQALREQLASGKSYPRARYDALEACGAPSALLEALRSPNSILGMEYIRFLKQYTPDAQPVAIHRKGSGYNDATLAGEFPSATAIREALFRGDTQALDGMPMYIAGRFGLGGMRPVGLQDAELLMLYALRRMSAEDIAEIPDVQEGFENVLYRAARQSANMEELFAQLKSKRYTMARCKRIAMCAMLGITKNLSKSVMAEDALYLRVLGFRRGARPLLSAIAHKRSLPLLIRRADIAACPPAAQDQIDLDLRAHDIYALLARQESPLRDFSQPPIVI